MKLLPVNDEQVSLLRNLIRDELSAMTGGEISYGTDHTAVQHELVVLITNLEILAAGGSITPVPASPFNQTGWTVKDTGSVTATGGGIANSGVIIR
jgi:hypothetical protein